MSINSSITCMWILEGGRGGEGVWRREAETERRRGRMKLERERKSGG